LDPIQAKEALFLAQMTIANRVPDPFMSNHAIGIKEALRHLSAR
jgi:hypothetical protein